ncbi:MAG: coenzyme F420-0:L-glutamate ligase [Oscillospiraceae bacterium]|nr:coenzyme F420-0:L-glutamate ligase [Oscillospiraceae bacterium]
MSNTLGTISRGIKAPMIKEGDNLSGIVTESVITAARENGIEFRDRDVVAVTEAVLARAQGNYADVSHIAEDVRNKFRDGKNSAGEIGVIFPILSRNRFAVCLKGIANAAEKICLMLSYPSDEVGNRLITVEQLEEKGVNPYTDILSEKQFRELFGYNKHIFTGIDYIDYYKEIIESAGAEAEVIFANNPLTILDFTKNVICADIHTRKLTKEKLLKNGALKVVGLDEILCTSVGSSGFNPDYGLLGSNKAGEDRVKLFPKDCHAFVAETAAKFLEKTGKRIEVMIYGDGAFKDPVGFIWELADPVVSPAYTEGLEGTPNEIKIKYIADNEFSHLQGEELKSAIFNKIKQKSGDLKGNMESEGTTPRRLPDLLGSLADLTSGSGDKGTPIVLIQGYFENYAD